ncbi:MAG: NHL repeat-containing protein [Chloroflexi bacterium]|nr:NHL repeat-containing protein [Chloroflexota bacterium]
MLETAKKPSSPPYALLRAGFPFLATLGMRRVTTYCMDIVIGDNDELYVLCRADSPGLGGSNIRRTNWNDDDLDTLGGGKLLWPVQMIRDAEGTLYVSDEGNHKIFKFKQDGTAVGEWGEEGSGEGQMNRPSGIAFDADENLWVVDTLNHRVQKFNKDGRYISGFGSKGSGPGEFDMPWGIAVTGEGDILVADWHNDRVQRFTPDGEFIMEFGSSGSGDGEFNRPAGVEVDHQGDIYVADRGNNRIQQFAPDGRYVDKFIGDATLSKSGEIYVRANPAVLRNREMANTEQQKRLRGPAMVRFDDQERMYIPDFGSHRIQVYKKQAYVLSPAEIAPQPNHPTLYTV